jgi:hypothetical protein
MEDYPPDAAPGFGWPADRIWVNPSPNAPNLNMARCYAGTVMLEGTTLSEGRGTTRPLELFGAPDIEARAVMKIMQGLAPDWLEGCIIRDIWFEPTFHKHVGQLCSGLHIHAEGDSYDHAAFKPWRLQAARLQGHPHLVPGISPVARLSLRICLWEAADRCDQRVAAAARMVDDPEAEPGDLEALAAVDETAWAEERSGYLIY